MTADGEWKKVRETFIIAWEHKIIWNIDDLHLGKNRVVKEKEKKVGNFSHVSMPVDDDAEMTGRMKSAAIFHFLLHRLLPLQPTFQFRINGNIAAAGGEERKLFNARRVAKEKKKKSQKAFPRLFFFSGLIFQMATTKKKEEKVWK